MKNLTIKLISSIGILSMAGITKASDTSDEFYTYYSTIEKWSQGALGTGLAMTMLLMGAGVGVAKNSPMPALSGVAGGAFLHWGPQIIKNMMGYSGAMI